MYKIKFIPTLVFEILKSVNSLLGMPDPIHIKLHHQFVALLDMYLHAKDKFYTSNSFWDIWLGERIFAFNSRTTLFPDMHF